MRFAGEAWDGRSAIDLARLKPMDVLVLDLQMPGQGGLDSLGMIRAKAPQLGVLILSNLPEEHYALTLMRLGSAGYPTRQCDPEEIVRAIRTVAAGKRYISPAVAQLMADSLGREGARLPHETLTDREFQLLVRFARGAGSTEIANDLSLSPKTVSTYRTVLLHKLGLHTNSDMTHYALQHGLID